MTKTWDEVVDGMLFRYLDTSRRINKYLSARGDFRRHETVIKLICRKALIRAWLEENQVSIPEYPSPDI